MVLVPVLFRFILLSTLILCLITIKTAEGADKQHSKNDEFAIELARQYVFFADARRKEGDWFDADYFANKALKLIKGQDVEPEELSMWQIPDNELATMLQARDYLIAALGYGVSDKFPMQAAKVQFLFDCWVEQQEDKVELRGSDNCKEGFYKALDNIFMLTTTGKVMHKYKEVKKPQIMDTRLVYFKIGGSKLDPGANRMIKNLATKLKDIPSYDISLNGYADMVGGEEFNMVLSKKRALSVKEALVKAGLDRKSITIFAFGQSGRVKTAKGVASKENRVVEIIPVIK